jgi:hypothetical protein
MRPRGGSEEGEPMGDTPTMIEDVKQEIDARGIKRLFAQFVEIDSIEAVP